MQFEGASLISIAAGPLLQATSQDVALMVPIAVSAHFEQWLKDAGCIPVL